MLYDFKRLIKKYGVDFEILIFMEGSYERGKWRESEPEIKNGEGAILPIGDKKLYGSGGTYDSEDRLLYTYTPIETALEGTRIRYKNNVYSVVEATDYGDYGDVYVYTLKRVSTDDRF